MRPLEFAPPTASVAHPDHESKMGVWDSIASAKALQPVPESGFSDLRDLRSALDLIDLDEAVAALEGPRRVGRRVSPPAAYAAGVPGQPLPWHR